MEASYSIRVNGETVGVSESELSGAQVRALFAVPHDWKLLVEGVGANDPDRTVDDETIVALRDEPRLFTIPPTNGG